MVPFATGIVRSFSLVYNNTHLNELSDTIRIPHYWNPSDGASLGRMYPHFYLPPSSGAYVCHLIIIFNCLRLMCPISGVRSQLWEEDQPIHRVSVTILHRICAIVADTILIFLTWRSLRGRTFVHASTALTGRGLMGVIIRDGLSQMYSKP